MEVRKIMTKNPACCTSDSTLQEVAHMMEMYDCGCIPVVEDHKTNKPIGTITDRDIAIRTLAAGGNPADMKASDIMTTDIATVTPETTVEQCRDEMEERQIRRILVVDKTGRCVGIVAQADVVQNETNPQQTAEFIRDISSASSGSQSQYGGGASMNQFGVRDQELSGSVSADRDSYRNFSNRSDDYEQSFSSGRSGRAFAKNDKKRKKSFRKEKSFFSLSSILPLLVGVGAGAALKYYMAVDQKSQTTFVPRGEVSTSLHTAQETTPKVSIELPTTPAKTETTTQTRIDMTDSRDTSVPNTRFSPDDDSDTNLGIGRTAKL